MKPTTNEGGQLMIAERTSTKRRSETFQAVSRIHGGSPSNVMTTLSGLVDTLATKFSEKDLVKIISKSPKLCEKVFPKIYNQKLKEFEASNQNMLRSISTYFSRGVMAKRKYRSVYKSISMSDSSEPKMHRVNGNKRIKVMSCNVVRLVPYDKMMAYVRSLEIGTLHCVKEDFCYELDDCEKIEGCYRHLYEFLPLLAKFYFKLAEISEENLLWFNNEIKVYMTQFLFLLEYIVHTMKKLLPTEIGLQSSRRYLS